MTTIQKFSYTWPDGVEPITFGAWINNLPAGERLEYDLAEQRQQAYVGAVPGLTISTDPQNHSNIWSGTCDPTAIEKDPVWLHYRNRYLTETQATMTVDIETQ
jgi:hypothetical protein